jgi:hypothetical protein
MQQTKTITKDLLIASFIMLLASLWIGLAANTVHATFPGQNGKIVFYSDRDGAGGGFGEIYIMNSDGTGQTNISNSPGYDDEPTWSPNGTKIAFYSDRDGNNEIYTMNPDGTGLSRITNNSVNDFDPSWSPDGSKISFDTDRDGNYEIYSMNADGTGQTRLTNNASYDSTPTWSPDGTKIAFDSDRDGNNELYVMNADGTGQTRLTNIAGYDYNADWQPLIAPVATNDPALVTAFGTPVVIDVLSNDSDTYGGLDPASVTVTVSAGNGTTTVNSTNGAITYTPNAGFSGTDTFTYRVCSSESASLCDTAVVTITVSAGVVKAASTLPGLPVTGIEPGQDVSKGLVAAVISLGSVLVGKYILRLSRKKING